MYEASDIVLRYGATAATTPYNAATATSSGTTTCAAASVVPFWQQNGEQMLLEEDEGRSTAEVTPSTSPSGADFPALFPSAAAASDDETSFNLANLRVALEEAVNSGHVDESAVRTILLQVASHASQGGAGGDTPLHIAAALGQERIATVLLLEGADADVLDSNGRTPLHLAVERGHLPTVKAILAADPDMGIRYKVGCRGYSVLDLAAREGNTDILRALLQHGVNVNRRTDGYTSLHIAALNNNVGAIDVLIEAGADMEIEDDDDCTPFLDACSNHCHQAALALFQHGANIEARDIRGETALQIAARQAGREGVSAMVNLLLRCGSDETAVNRNGRTAAEIVGHHIEYAACPLKKEDVDRVRELLANAPADRAWRRRGYLVLCKARLLRPRTRGARGSQNRMGLHDENERSRHQPGKGGGSLDGGTGEPYVSAPIVQVDNVAAGDVRSAIVRVMELAEEGLFRNIVSFL